MTTPTLPLIEETMKELEKIFEVKWRDGVAIEWGVEKSDIEKVKSFLLSTSLTMYEKGREEERTEMLRRVEEEAEKLVEQIRETDLAIRKSDKTPKYEYSHKRCDANRDGEFPEAGARWAMPYELSNGLLRNAENYLAAVREILSAEIKK